MRSPRLCSGSMYKPTLGPVGVTSSWLVDMAELMSREENDGTISYRYWPGPKFDRLFGVIRTKVKMISSTN